MTKQVRDENEGVHIILREFGDSYIYILCTEQQLVKINKTKT